MARFDLDGWLKDPARLGARVSSRDLKGVLGIFGSDRLAVPEGTAALVRYPDGTRRLLKAGEEAVGEFEAVLVKPRGAVLDVRLESLLSREDLPFVFTAAVEVAVDAADDDAVNDFAGAFLASAGDAGADAVGALLRPPIEETVRNFVAARMAEDLARGDHSAEIETLLREGLKRPLFEAGLLLDEVQSVRFESAEYERILSDKIEATVEGERGRRREIIRAAWVKDQKDEILSDREVRDLMRALEHEGALKELERRREKIMAEKEIQALADRVQEEKLVKEARTVSNLMKVLEEAGAANVVETFLDIAREQARRQAAGPGTGLDPRLHDVPEGTARRVLCAAGRQVLAFRTDRTAPAEVHSFASGTLGMLRSVRMARAGGEDLLLAGAQYGVYVMPFGGRAREFPIPGAGDRRGGVNAAAVHRDHLYATHSDYGLLRWPLAGEPGPGEVVRADLTAGKETVRAVQLGPLDRLLFAAGNEVFSLLPESLDGTPTVFSGGGEAVTSLAATARSLFAGTAGGEVLRWDWTAPDAASRRETAKRPDPIFMLKTCLFRDHPHLLVGWKGYGVLVKALETDTEITYPAEVRVRWVDGASDFVFGVDRDGRRLLAWEAGNPRARPVEFRSEERIQDLCVWREEG